MSPATLADSPSFLRRLAAMTYDLFLVLPLIMLVMGLLMAGHYLIAGPPPPNTATILNPWLVRLSAALAVMAFFCRFWLKGGQTLGMQAWRVRLVRFDGGKPTLRQALLRCLGAAISLICLGLGYLWCLVDRHNRYWHDHLSGTELRLLPSRKKNTGSTAITTEHD